MASKTETVKDETVKVFVPIIGSGSYGLDVVEISKSILDKHGKVETSYEPDIFAICINNLTKAFRDAFGI